MRNSLPEPDISATQSKFVAPQTPIQIIIANIWAEVLGIEKIGIHDNFLELGGHSLSASLVISRLREALSLELSIALPKAQLSRASSMTQIRLAIAEILSPVLAAALLATVQFSGIVIIDLSTLALALICLLVVKFPEISSTENADAETNSFWQQITFGWKYLVARPGLLGLVMFIAMINFLVGSAEALTTPLVLSFASAQSLGTIYSISSFGLLLGCAVMSIGQIIGVGHGRGIGLMFIILGLFSLVVTLMAYLYPRLCCVENELPDAIPDQPEVS